VPPDEWLHVPVPPLVDAAIFAVVQDQLQENRRHACQGLRDARYLLQGLLCCAHCGYAYYGKAISPSTRKHHPRHYAYYRCLGTDAYRFGGQRVCSNRQLRTDLLDLAVWHEACTLLDQPHRLEHEYRERLDASNDQASERTAVQLQRAKLRQGLSRLIDSYTEGFLEKQEFELRVTRQRQRIATLDEQARQLEDAEALQRKLHLLIGRLENFAAQVEHGLDEFQAAGVEVSSISPSISWSHSSHSMVVGWSYCESAWPVCAIRAAGYGRYARCAEKAV
jgi:site-specific DNA recombinase